MSSCNLADSVTSIGNAAFSGCSSLSTITIPDSVTSIDEYAFYLCSRLSKIVFLGVDDDNPLSIGSDAFRASYPTIYCYMFSPADVWCSQNGKTPIYLDEINIDTIRRKSRSGNTTCTEFQPRPHGEIAPPSRRNSTTIAVK